MNAGAPLTGAPLRSLVSIHDVMPQTLPQVREILQRLSAWPNLAVTLLVIPGRNWSSEQIAELRDWQSRGRELAGHGWLHTVTRRSSLYHKLHGLLFSRMVAEHLALSEQGICDLLQRCHDWFGEHGLEAPQLYVPPAWALGKIPRARLARTPFASYETFGGIIDAASGRLERLPLTGYEADTPLRTRVLAGWNRYNEKRAITQDRPLRISIHPYDLQLGLAGQLLEQLQHTGQFLLYRSVVKP
ncbi:MAG: hypothetical protein RLZZ385_1768 [Pseudomonadota bacterium]|jgi:predicted deacetylase